MSAFDLNAMCQHYRNIRKAVFEEATVPTNGSLSLHEANKQKVRQHVTAICDNASLSLHCGTGPDTARRIWQFLWTRNRYAGIRSSIATKEIFDIADVFDSYETFCSPDWDIESNGHILKRAGVAARAFLDRTGPFHGRQTIGNYPKLKKIVAVARRLNAFMQTKLPSQDVLDFVTNGYSVDDVWAIHRHLLSIGYTADLTALHFMMDIGFAVMKPDIVISRLFLKWGWLHSIVNGLPLGCSPAELIGKGGCGSRFKYTSPRVYKPVIELARKVAQATRREDLVADIGWATHNPLREFDVFVVKYGQMPEPEYGFVRTLDKGADGIAGDITCSTATA